MSIEPRNCAPDRVGHQHEMKLSYFDTHLVSRNFFEKEVQVVCSIFAIMSMPLFLSMVGWISIGQALSVAVVR